MARTRGGPSKQVGRKKSAASGKRKALNAFSIEKEDLPAETQDVDDILESEEEGVKSEDDEEIDSDEAFGDSDEEKYSDFKFLGSSARRIKVISLSSSFSHRRERGS